MNEPLEGNPAISQEDLEQQWEDLMGEKDPNDYEDYNAKDYE